MDNPFFNLFAPRTENIPTEPTTSGPGLLNLLLGTPGKSVAELLTNLSGDSNPFANILSSSAAAAEVAPLPTPASYQREPTPLRVSLPPAAPTPSTTKTPQPQVEDTTPLVPKSVPTESITPQAPAKGYTPPPAEGKVYDPFGNYVKGKDQSRLAPGPTIFSPEEKNLYNHHYGNLSGGKYIDSESGRSTVKAITVGVDGRTYVIPTIWDGKELSGEDAFRKAQSEGLTRFPSYGSEQEAQARYEQMHRYMDSDVQKSLKDNPMKGPTPSKMGLLTPRPYMNNDTTAETAGGMLEDAEAEINRNNSLPGYIDPQALENEPTRGWEMEDDYNNYDPNARERQARLFRDSPDPARVDPVRVQAITQHMNRTGNMNLLRNVALDPMLAELQTEAINFLASMGGMKLAGDVVPLPITPGPNAGPATAQEIREGYRQGLPRLNTNTDYSRRIKARL